MENRVSTAVVSCWADTDDGTSAKIMVRQGLVSWRSRSSILRELEKYLGSQVILHSHGLWHPLNHWAISAAKELGIGYVVSTHGMLMPWARMNRSYRKDIAWFAYQRDDLMGAALIHATSSDEANETLRVLPAARVALVPFGVDFPGLMGAPLKASSSRRFLFLGRRHPVKNLVGLLDAFAGLSDRNWRLKLVGPDESGYTKELRECIRRNGLTNQVEIVGPVYGAQKDQLFREAHILILPSFSENFGAVVAEAMAASLPVIATHGTPWSMLAEHGCGWWVAPDVCELRRAIQESLALSCEELVEMGRRGKLTAAEHFSWSSCGVRMLELYLRALNT